MLNAYFISLFAKKTGWNWFWSILLRIHTQFEFSASKLQQKGEKWSELLLTVLKWWLKGNSGIRCRKKFTVCPCISEMRKQSNENLHFCSSHFIFLTKTVDRFEKLLRTRQNYFFCPIFFIYFFFFFETEYQSFSILFKFRHLQIKFYTQFFLGHNASICFFFFFSTESFFYKIV